jgi:hypothetical protein
MPRKVGFFSTLQGFAVAMLMATVGVCVLFAVCLSLYDPDRRGAFGIPERYVSQIMSAYAPVVGGTLVGFRNVLFETFVSVDASSKTKLMPIRSGAGVLYGVAGFGVAFAVAALALVSTGIPEPRAKWFIGVGATVWAATVGSVFERFFKQYAARPGAAEKPEADSEAA